MPACLPFPGFHSVVLSAKPNHHSTFLKVPVFLELGKGKNFNACLSSLNQPEKYLAGLIASGSLTYSQSLSHRLLKPKSGPQTNNPGHTNYCWSTGDLSRDDWRTTFLVERRRGRRKTEWEGFACQGQQDAVVFQLDFHRSYHTCG